MKKNHKILREEAIIIGDSNNLNATEAYNRLKDNVLYFSLDGNNRVIQIESSIAGEGKTTLTANLAVALAQTEKKVIIVDLDFRKSRTHRPFKIENIDGLTDYLIDKVSYEKMIKKTEYKVDLINRGSAIQNSTSVLMSDKFKELINNLKNTYDYVLLDCPPVLAISDYIHIGQVSDCCIFAVSHGNTKKSQVLDAISELKKNNINVLGTVFTFYNHKIDHKESGYRYGYYDKKD